MSPFRCAIGVAALIVAGCAAQMPSNPAARSSPVGAAGGEFVTMRYQSKPMGALVVRDGVVLGRTPLIHREPVRWSREEGRTVVTCTAQMPLTFQWDSGAAVTVQYPCQQFPEVIAGRPDSAPGLDADLDVEKQLLAQRARLAASAVRFWGVVTPFDNPNSWIHRPNEGLVSGLGLSAHESNMNMGYFYQ